MLKDIVTITIETFNEAFCADKILSRPKRVYDVYRNLQELISNVSLVSNHYLALDFTEHFLENSSFGEPIDKWRYFFNEDLKKLNESIKNYLFSISYLAFEDGFETIVSKKYNCKSYYGFVRDNYNIGFVEPVGSMLHITKLELKDKDNARYLAKYLKIDITTFESKKELQDKLNKRNELLKIELKKVKTYIQTKYVLDDLL